MEVDVTPSGVLAEWIARDDPELSWSGTLPHWNLDVSRAFTQGSSDHDRLWELLKQQGTLQLLTILDASDVLRPKVQIGAVIDYEWPVEQVTVSLLGPVEKYDIIGLQGKPPSVHAAGNASLHSPVQVMLESLEGRGPLVEFKATYRLEGSATGTPGISIATQEDPEQRAIPLHRFHLPGFEQTDAPKLESELAMPKELEGGNWGRGRRIFLGAKAKCSACHREPGFGATLIGPDLSNLIHRDYASVLRDITHPSYAINPEFIGQKIRMNDGTVLTGVLREQEGELLLGDAEGKTQILARESIEEMSPSATSTMPTGLLDSLSEQERKDLLTYLLRPAPSMPLERPNPSPPMRTAAEVADVLAGSTVSSEPYRPMKIVLVAGPKDHGPNEHDYPAWLIQWGQLLAAAEQVTVEAAWEFPDAKQLEDADALIFFQKGSWNAERARAMDTFFQRGGGALYLHWAVNGDDEVQGFADRIGLASWGGRIHYRHGPLTMKVHNTDHPILRNIKDFELLDESYWLLTGSEKEITVLATSDEEGAPRPQLWTYERHAGRVFVSIPGHYSWTFDDPIFRTVVLRGIAWISKEPIDRFNDLVPLGARISK
jgi:putative heme-binding domain-containing protein